MRGEARRLVAVLPALLLAGCFEFDFFGGPGPPPCPAWAPDFCPSWGCVDLRLGTPACGACDVDCTSGSCQAGVCTCNPGTTRCSGSTWRCADLSADPAHCGACGNVCPGLQRCQGGACACLAPQATCGGECVDPAWDRRHCGGCGQACPEGADCSGGTCFCGGGTEVCGPPGSPCVPIDTLERCGACDVSCAAGDACLESRCCPVTPAGCTTGAACCAGGCCPEGACHAWHTTGPASIGLGQEWLSCRPLVRPFELTWTDAQEAAWTWSVSQGLPGSGLSTRLCDPACLSWRTPRQCVTWCFGGGATPGKVFVSPSTSCTCLDVAEGAWY